MYSDRCCAWRFILYINTQPRHIKINSNSAQIMICSSGSQKFTAKRSIVRRSVYIDTQLDSVVE